MSMGSGEQKQTGGPAFPAAASWIPNTGECYSGGYDGMSIRDWLAGLAMQASIANGGTFASGYMLNAARDAYKMADAMLKARDE